MTPEHYIATRTWSGRSPAGELGDVQIRIAAPTRNPEGLASCVADPGFGETPVSIFGEDSWQALELAMKYCRDIARAKVALGWQLRVPDTDELLTSADL